MKEPAEADCRHGEYTICPYCGAQFGDSWEYNPNSNPNKTECTQCGKEYWQWAEYDVDYCTAKVEE